MGDKSTGRNFPGAAHPRTGRDRDGRYGTEGYYENNRDLGRSRQQRPLDADDQEMYDEFNTGKEENYHARGYYGSNYGGIVDWNRGRDIERNAGYRDNYNQLPAGQWPEIDDAASRRGMDFHWHELQSRGVHRGKGPRSYQRSDERISEDVHDVLMEDGYIDATEVAVTVDHGEVILTGMVEDRNMKRRAEDIIEDQVSGIRHLENRLHTRFPHGKIVNVRRSSGR